MGTDRFIGHTTGLSKALECNNKSADNIRSELKTRLAFTEHIQAPSGLGDQSIVTTINQARRKRVRPAGGEDIESRKRPQRNHDPSSAGISAINSNYLSYPTLSYPSIPPAAVGLSGSTDSHIQYGELEASNAWSLCGGTFLSNADFSIDTQTNIAPYDWNN